MHAIEAVPNVSEGRRRDVVDRLARTIRSTAGVHLLDYSADAEHHRSVFTFAGEGGAISRATLALYEAALPEIDLRQHHGAHPRVGAIDVVPFVPIGTAEMRECITLAEDTAAHVANRFGIPVYLYEAAARTPARKNLENIRRGEFEGLADKMRSPEWAPDFGPPHPHPTAGVSIFGARQPLVAFNINLATNRLDVARRIAAVIRERGGGLPAVKALGLRLADRGIVQVSMNLTDYTKTSMPAVFEAVAREAQWDNVKVLESELIGLVPEGALGGASSESLMLKDFDDGRILERVLRTK